MTSTEQWPDPLYTWRGSQPARLYLRGEEIAQFGLDMIEAARGASTNACDGVPKGKQRLLVDMAIGAQRAAVEDALRKVVER